MSVRLGEVQGMSHNLHFFRFAAAILVIMSHSFALSSGNFEGEWFYHYSGGQVTMGAFAVGVFFLYSGFLITRGFKKAPTGKEFFVVRCARIFPLLFMTVSLSVIILGPLMTQVSLTEYFKDINTYKYFLNSIFVLQHDLPGVFKDNIYTATVNGALWTLPVEFLCYVICFGGHKLKILVKGRLWMTIPFVILGSLGTCYIAAKVEMPMLTTVLFPVLCFYVGVLFAIYRDCIIMNYCWFIVSLVLFGILGYLGYLKLGFVLFFSYSLIYIAFGSRELFPHMWKSGNWSYAMYLCGFPIQQAVVAINGGRMNPYINMIITIPIIIFIAILLYETIEKRVSENLNKLKAERD